MWSNYFEDDDSNTDDERPTMVSMTDVENDEIDMVITSKETLSKVFFLY